MIDIEVNQIQLIISQTRSPLKCLWISFAKELLTVFGFGIGNINMVDIKMALFIEDSLFEVWLLVASYRLQVLIF